MVDDMARSIRANVAIIVATEKKGGKLFFTRRISLRNGARRE